ncbi:endothelial differentiation-related factor 1 homolog [Eurytemora carolleeae]|uniref:endothelial differentiation-related factor 1 homolog n=1 Tax=Eurytemora carolleeae TaxID=1294199 RepID=UPI000C75E3E1|nr:endothelial differentiation-related factor 1 homolog [Eurytemora carolleeae]|eukprot:XP_023328369.1 endothelial differentiation-related factor 1 homolog [Eurytemora affinis]
MDDWNSVTVIGSRRNAAAGGGNKERSLNIARRQGAHIITESKYGAAGNTQKGTTLNTAKLDAETEELKHKTVDLNVGKLIQKGRQAKEMTQKELATKMNEKPQVVIEYEQGKAIPNNIILAKMERILGIKLRGKDKGQPLEPKEPKKEEAKKTNRK